MSRSLKHALFAAAVATALYLPSLRFGFTYDDAAVVENQPQITGHAWGAMLVSPYHTGATTRTPTGLYRPLATLSLAANHAVSGLHPWSYHLLNVLLHALVAALVVALGAALGLPPQASLVAGLAFAVHPVHVEPVANVAGRAELLSSAFAAAALALYLQGRRVAASVLALAACFSKENAVTLAGIVLLWEVVNRAPLRAALRRAAVVIIPAVAYLLVRVAVLGGLTVPAASVTAVENPVVGLHGLARAGTLLATFARAAALVLTPLRLAPDYGFADTVASRSLLSPGPLAGLAVLAALTAGIVWAWRPAPRVAFLFGASAIAYAIVSNVLVVIGTILGDRLLYFPSVFLCLLFGIAVARISGWASWTLAAIVLAALTVRAAIYLPKWRDDTTLFAYAARVAPDSVRSVGSWGALLAESGKLEEARPLLDRAVALAPDFIPARLNRAAAEMMAGDLDAAEADARHVLSLDPDDPMARRQLAAIAARR
ncbi:MAG TPA: tetratricopeptide repeat protein [Candidatus Polarisedimenticolaceae bacterium]|nr:tetratricopeptide repeat protein [Candidatus Polarisedimenticolaceae bacterium]